MALQRISWRGLTFNGRTIEMIKAAEDILGSALYLTQGSYNRGVGASFGTHDGGGAVDCWPAMGEDYAEAAVMALRVVGFAAWHRDPSQGPWNHHIHAIAIGDKELSESAQQQVEDYYNGLDGLSGGNADNHPRPSPIPVWGTGAVPILGSNTFADAPAISYGSVSAPTPNAGLSMEAGEPNSWLARSAWWKFIAPQTETVGLDTLLTDVGGQSPYNFDTVIVVYWSPGNVNPGFGDLVEVAFGDDHSRTLRSAYGYLTEMDFEASEGETYWVQVAAYDEYTDIDYVLRLGKRIYENTDWVQGADYERVVGEYGGGWSAQTANHWTQEVVNYSLSSASAAVNAAAASVPDLAPLELPPQGSNNLGTPCQLIIENQGPPYGPGNWWWVSQVGASGRAFKPYLYGENAPQSADAVQVEYENSNQPTAVAGLLQWQILTTMSHAYETLGGNTSGGGPGGPGFEVRYSTLPAPTDSQNPATWQVSNVNEFAHLVHPPSQLSMKSAGGHELGTSLAPDGSFVILERHGFKRNGNNWTLIDESTMQPQYNQPPVNGNYQMVRQRWSFYAELSDDINPYPAVVVNYTLRPARYRYVTPTIEIVEVVPEPPTFIDSGPKATARRFSA